MSGLAVSFSSVRSLPEAGQTWVIGIERFAPKSVLVYGFACKLDAQIGMDALSKCGIDWMADHPELRRAIKASGGFEGLKKIACENLRW